MNIESKIRWEYEDSRGIKRTGTIKSISDHGGTDVTYIFEREDNTGIDCISGSRLKLAHRIWE